MSADRGGIIGPPPSSPNSVENWAERHRSEGHRPYPAPTSENPERWECRCDPDAPWTAVWRILTVAQIRQKYAHLARQREPDVEASRRAAVADLYDINGIPRGWSPDIADDGHEDG